MSNITPLLSPFVQDQAPLSPPPCTWEEVERGEVAPRSITIRNMAQRIEDVGNLWSDLLKTNRQHFDLLFKAHSCR